MELFEFDENFEVVVRPQALTLLPFREVVEKYPNKEIGIAELSYIVLLCHPKSDYADIRNEEERSAAILLSIIHGDKIVVDSVTTEAIKFYRERSHTSLTLFLDSLLGALDKTANYFNGIDYAEVNKRGDLKYDPKKVIEAAAVSPKLINSIRELKDQIRKEQELEQGVRGSGQKGIYEDGN
jgi:hypothetical protein